MLIYRQNQPQIPWLSPIATPPPQCRNRSELSKGRKNSAAAADTLELDCHFDRLIANRPEKIAQQLTLIQLDYFKAIRPEELRSMQWNGKNKESIAPNIVASTRWFNKVIFWVQKEILNRQEARQRANLIGHFVQIAKNLTNMNNFASGMAVVSALLVQCIYRLESSWCRLDSKSMTTFTELTTIYSFDNNFRDLRLVIEKSSLPCIPYLGIYLSELTYIGVIGSASQQHEASKSWDKQGRERRISRVLRTISNFQQSVYPFTRDDRIVAYLKSQPYMEELRRTTEDINYNLSLKLEPDSQPANGSNLSGQQLLAMHETNEDASFTLGSLRRLIQRYLKPSSISSSRLSPPNKSPQLSDSGINSRRASVTGNRLNNNDHSSNEDDKSSSTRHHRVTSIRRPRPSSLQRRQASSQLPPAAPSLVSGPRRLSREDLPSCQSASSNSNDRNKFRSKINSYCALDVAQSVGRILDTLDIPDVLKEQRLLSPSWSTYSQRTRRHHPSHPVQSPPDQSQPPIPLNPKIPHRRRNPDGSRPSSLKCVDRRRRVVGGATVNTPNASSSVVITNEPIRKQILVAHDKRSSSSTMIHRQLTSQGSSDKSISQVPSIAHHRTIIRPVICPANRIIPMTIKYKTNGQLVHNDASKCHDRSTVTRL